MAEGKTALKQQALATLQAGRREISAEAPWIRKGLSPKRVAKNLINYHTRSVLLVLAAVGVGVVVHIHRGSKARARASVDESGRLFDQHRGRSMGGKTSARTAEPARTRVGMTSYLAEVVLKSVTPFLIQSALKFAEQHLTARPTS
jgi:hypothetical protein